MREHSVARLKLECLHMDSSDFQLFPETAAADAPIRTRLGYIVNISNEHFKVLWPASRPVYNNQSPGQSALPAPVWLGTDDPQPPKLIDKLKDFIEAEPAAVEYNIWLLIQVRRIHWKWRAAFSAAVTALNLLCFPSTHASGDQQMSLNRWLRQHPTCTADEVIEHMRSMGIHDWRPPAPGEEEAAVARAARVTEVYLEELHQLQRDHLQCSVDLVDDLRRQLHAAQADLHVVAMLVVPMPGQGSQGLGTRPIAGNQSDGVPIKATELPMYRYVLHEAKYLSACTLSSPCPHLNCSQSCFPRTVRLLSSYGNQ